MTDLTFGWEGGLCLQEKCRFERASAAAPFATLRRAISRGVVPSMQRNVGSAEAFLRSLERHSDAATRRCLLLAEPAASRQRVARRAPRPHLFCAKGFATAGPYSGHAGLRPKAVPCGMANLKRRQRDPRVRAPYVLVERGRQGRRGLAGALKI
jgi:hypothetical protein